MRLRLALDLFVDGMKFKHEHAGKRTHRTGVALSWREVKD